MSMFSPIALLNLDQEISSKPLEMSFSFIGTAPYEALGVALARYLTSWMMSRFSRGGSRTPSSEIGFVMLFSFMAIDGGVGG
jgi:hypothetical protein